MKRLLVILLILTLCACTAVPGPAGPSVSASTPAPAATPTPDPVDVYGDTISVVESTPAPSPTPEPTDTPVPTDTPEPTPTPDPRFTMVWASDTQLLVAYEDLLPGYISMCDWIVREADEQRFRLFLHTGDMVDNGAKRGQWERFCQYLRPVADKMPLFMTAGNHDWYFNQKTYWKDQFFVTEFPQKQTFDGGNAAYMIFTVGETSLLLLSVCYIREHRDPELTWLREICDAHPDLPAILVTHGYLTAEGELVTIAQKLEREVVAQCPNIRLVLCGHARGIARRVFTYDDDGDGEAERTVNVLLYDLQTDRERYGYLCLLHYDPADNTLTADSYSPFLDDYIYDDENPETERFTLYDVF